VIGCDARGDSQRGHGGESRERDERAAAVVRGANESDEIDVAKKRSVGSPFTSEHHQPESAGAQQLVHSAQRVHATLGPHEERAFFPERAGGGSRDIDPGRAVSLPDRCTTRGAHDGCCAAARLPHGQPAEWEATTRQRTIELCDPRGDRVSRMPCDLNGVGKTLFEQDSEGGDLGRHGMKMIPNKYRNNKRRFAVFLMIDEAIRCRYTTLYIDSFSWCPGKPE
jgi:hypothetical protein